MTKQHDRILAAGAVEELYDRLVRLSADIAQRYAPAIAQLHGPPPADGSPGWHFPPGSEAEAAWDVDLVDTSWLSEKLNQLDNLRRALAREAAEAPRRR